MESVVSVFIYILSLAIGFGLQLLIRWSPWLNLAISFLVVLFLPPNWSIGLVGGTWISCAFFTYNPEQERRFDVIQVINWSRTILSSLWTFAGFLLTLVFLWKLKVTNSLDVGQREIMAWYFLILVEICLYRVIARLSPNLYRGTLGYRIAFLNFLMILFWIVPLGIIYICLIFLTLMVINPLILMIVDRPLTAVEDSIFRRR